MRKDIIRSEFFAIADMFGIRSQTWKNSLVAQSGILTEINNIRKKNILFLTDRFSGWSSNGVSTTSRRLWSHDPTEDSFEVLLLRFELRDETPDDVGITVCRKSSMFRLFEIF